MSVNECKWVFDIPKLELQGFNNSGRSETGEFRADLDGSNRET